jgi:DNA-binding Lrp family transcriptional regulator
VRGGSSSDVTRRNPSGAGGNLFSQNWSTGPEYTGIRPFSYTIGLHSETRREGTIVRDVLQLDKLDFALLEVLHSDPKIGVLELSRRLRVARATGAARLRRLEDGGLIAGYGPQVDLAAAGFDVQAFVTMEIAQGALATIREVLESIPGVLEAFSTTGTGDILCRIAADSHLGLQHTLIELNRSSIITRSTSVMVLSNVVPFRVMPLLRTLQPSGSAKAPAYRPPQTTAVPER